jgi:hypothetical protein
LTTGLKLYIRTPGKLEDFYAMATVAFSVPGTAEPVLIDYLQVCMWNRVCWQKRVRNANDVVGDEEGARM